MLKDVVLQRSEAQKGQVDREYAAGLEQRVLARARHVAQWQRASNVSVDVDRLDVLELRQQRRADGCGRVGKAEGGALRFEGQAQRVAAAAERARWVAHLKLDRAALLVRGERVIAARARDLRAIRPEEARVAHTAAHRIRVPARIVWPARDAERRARCAHVSARRVSRRERGCVRGRPGDPRRRIRHRAERARDLAHR